MNKTLIRDKLNRIIEQSSMIQNVEYFELIDSTNTYGLSRIKDIDCPKGGILILANQQSRGRGRREKEWESPAEGLYFSIVLDGMFPPLFSLIVGLSVSEAIESEYSIKTDIKWPNDVFIDDRKVSGILIETSCEKSVIGIGINTVSATALSLETAVTISENERPLSVDEKIDLIITFLNCLERYLDEYNDIGFANIRKKIEPKLLHIDQLVGIEMGETVHKGILKGLGQSGELMLLIEDELKAFHSGSLVKLNI